MTIHKTHRHVPVAALSQGITVRRQVGVLSCPTSVKPQWSYGGPPQNVWSAAGLHKSSPLMSCKNKVTLSCDGQYRPKNTMLMVFFLVTLEKETARWEKDHIEVL